MTHWTFESLAAADRETLEAVLLASRAPDTARLSGWAYDGYNHDRLGQMVGAKFRKVFVTEEHGLNQMVVQDTRGPAGEWRVQVRDGKPVEHGYFKVAPASSLERTGPYAHLLCLNYNVDHNPRWNMFMRAIRDFVGLPNAHEYGLLLGKAYLRLPFGRDLFASDFILGRPDKR